MSSKTALRRYIQKKNLHKSHLLENCSLLIDGDSFFKESYKNSGCQFLLGPECDKYLSYLNRQLECFSACNITCYVIFKGTTRDDLERRKKVHQQIIDVRRHIENSLNNLMYFEPLLVKDMQRQALQLSGIKYFYCEYDSLEAIIGVARALKCPVLTDKLEYCLYGVSCIQPNTITWEKKNTALQCTIYDQEKCKLSIGVYNKMPILLTVWSMISEFPECGNIEEIDSVIRWVKRQQKDAVDDIANKINDFNKRRVFLELYHRNKILYSYPSCHLAVKYFQRDRLHGLFKDDKKWFAKGVSNGRIALPYIDMKRKGLIIGSTVVNDTRQHDAIEAAAPIISYAHCLLTNSQKSSLNYIGRKNTICTMWHCEYYWQREICNRDIFKKYGKMSKKLSLGNPFKLFIADILSRDVAEDIFGKFLILNVHRRCTILLMTLVYYVQKVNKTFIDGAYFVLLCYTILGPVREKIDLRTSNENISKDCHYMHDKLKFLFQYDHLNLKYDTSILHSLAEFLHCLEHMNYLNNLCGQNFGPMVNVPNTLYYKTYNATFVYNTFIFMKSKNELMSYLEINFKDSWPLKLYKSLIFEFNKYLQLTSDQIKTFNLSS